MNNLKQIGQQLRKSASYHDVVLKAFNCPDQQKILGGDVISYAFIPNQPVQCQDRCTLCYQQVSQYYEWMIYYHGNQTQLPLNLCNKCNSPQKIWKFIFHDGSWLTKLFFLIMPRRPITFEMFFTLLILENNPRDSAQLCSKSS